MNNTVYRYLGGEEEDGIFACGYMEKTSAKSQIDFIIPYYSIFFLISGKGYYRDEHGFDFPLFAGSVVQRFPNTLHSTIVEDSQPWTEFFISLGKKIYTGMESIQVINPQNPVGFSTPSRELLLSFDRLLKKVKERANFTDLLRAQEIIFSLINTAASDNERIIESAKLILSTDLKRPIFAQEVAAELGLGHESFRKIFKKSTGLSPMDFRLDQKILTARLMLLGGSSIKETALSLGYSDSYSFAKQFKKKTGIPPGGIPQGFKKSGGTN